MHHTNWWRHIKVLAGHINRPHWPDAAYWPYHHTLLTSFHSWSETRQNEVVQSTSTKGKPHGTVKTVNICHSKLLISRYSVRSTTKSTTVSSTDKYKEHDMARLDAADTRTWRLDSVSCLSETTMSNDSRQQHKMTASIDCSNAAFD